MPRVVPISHATQYFTDPYAVTLGAFADRGLLVQVGKCRRVDVEKLRQQYPSIEFPAEWFIDTKPLEEVGVRQLGYQLPLVFGHIKTTHQLRHALWMGSYAKRQISATQTFYQLQQFKNPWGWEGDEERAYRLKGLHLAGKRGDLAAKISSLCTAWSESLQEKRLAWRRATGAVSNAEFDTAHSNLNVQVAMAPWGHKDVKALLKDFTEHV